MLKALGREAELAPGPGLVTTKFQSPVTLPVRSKLQLMVVGLTTLTPMAEISNWPLLVNLTVALGSKPAPVILVMLMIPVLKPVPGVMEVTKTASEVMADCIKPSFTI